MSVSGSLRVKLIYVSTRFVTDVGHLTQITKASLTVRSRVTDFEDSVLGKTNLQDVRVTFPRHKNRNINFNPFNISI